MLSPSFSLPLLAITNPPCMQRGLSAITLSYLLLVLIGLSRILKHWLLLLWQAVAKKTEATGGYLTPDGFHLWKTLSPRTSERNPCATLPCSPPRSKILATPLRIGFNAATNPGTRCGVELHTQQWARAVKRSKKDASTPRSAITLMNSLATGFVDTSPAV